MGGEEVEENCSNLVNICFDSSSTAAIQFKDALPMYIVSGLLLYSLSFRFKSNIRVC